MRHPRIFLLLLFLLANLSGCGPGKKSPAADISSSEIPSAEKILAEKIAEMEKQAEKIVQNLDDKDLAAQVIMAGIDGNVRISAAMRPLLEEIPVGAYMLFRYNLGGEKEAVRNFLEECSALTEAAGAGIRPFAAVDHEGGDVHRFSPAVERLPPALSYWEAAQKSGGEAALQKAGEDAFRSGSEIHEWGINLNLAPVAEILTEENKKFLEGRSYGGDPQFTAAAAAAFVRGMGEAGVACAAKHFPGNTGTDPHTGRGEMNADRAALDRMVFPFAEMIRSGPPSFIMVSHVFLPSIDKEKNASLSPKVMNGWLRGDLGFRGVILTDDFSMAAAEASGLGPGESAVEALNAGADMVMVWPVNLRSVHRHILLALTENRIPRERLEDAAERIILEKIRFGLIKE
ncbi:glycoside hydrolase family 3 [Spirochaetia bacterium]|nr:glycoside hydrolase family 3 [Spirochaetia bacterium]